MTRTDDTLHPFAGARVTAQRECLAPFDGVVTSADTEFSAGVTTGSVPMLRQCGGAGPVVGAVQWPALHLSNHPRLRAVSSVYDRGPVVRPPAGRGTSIRVESPNTATPFNSLSERTCEMAATTSHEQACPICPKPVTDPVFFEGALVCEEHVRPCGYCVGGRRLAGDEACGPCLAVLVRGKAA